MSGLNAETKPILSHVKNPTFESTSLIDGHLKYMVEYGLQDKEFLFDLDADPYETKNLAKQTHPALAALQARMDKYIARFEVTQIKRKGIELSEKEKNKLRALGYLK